MTGFGGGLRWIACMITGGTTLGGMTYGWLRVAGGGQSFRWGEKYCLKSNSGICLYLGPRNADGFYTKGIWLRQGGLASTGDQGIDQTGWFAHQGLGKDLQGIFKDHPGLQSFVESVITDFTGRGCKYESHSSSGTWWYEVKCTQGEPKGRQDLPR